MKEDFPELFEFCKNNIKFCPWAKQFKSEEFVEEFISEANELKQALENKDNENIAEEFGDALVDLISLAVIAEQEGKINTKDIIKGILNKMRERKPHVFEKREVSLEECRRVFYEVKARQKEARNQKI